jgi:DNA-binding transcriptional MerR regulator/effector-binding domain-containing protein
MWAIGEFSKISSLTVKTLRFYQEKGLLVPAAVDADSGYRYYDAAALEKARVIVALRALEFSLDEIGEILRGHDDESDILGYLAERKAEIAARMRRQREIVATLDRIIRSETEARQAIQSAEFRVEEKTVEPMLVAGLRYKGKYSDCGPRFAALGKGVGRWIAGKPFCLYFDGEYLDDEADIEPCFPIRKPVQVDGLSVRPLPGARVVSLVHKGAYDLLGRSYSKALAYVSDRRLSVALPTREVYLKGPGMIFRGNPRNYITEIQLPIAE